MTEGTERQGCRLCPRACAADRGIGSGYCGTGRTLEVAAVTLHHGEEPVISGRDGICNIFFSGCNLRCVYCQNHQISRPSGRLPGRITTFPDLIDRVSAFLDQGIENLGFVSPSHVVPHVRTLITELHRRGYHPIVVYNTNAYETVASLRSLEGLVDVFLPDFKYIDSELAGRLSRAPDYPEVARAALTEMYRQKGNRLRYTDSGKVQSGMIVRHLVLPGSAADSIEVVRFLADHLSPRLAISLMAQYRPPLEAPCRPPLDRKITAEEYALVVDEVERLGFTSGWLQDFASSECHVPDFTHSTPFPEQGIED